MRLNSRSFLALAALAGLAGACGGGGVAGPAGPPPVTLTILNLSQTEIEQIRVHVGDSFASAANLLPSPLADQASFDVQVEAGELVTVMRRDVSGGRLIAYTTAHGVDAAVDGYVLKVFQESFRLVAP